MSDRATIYQCCACGKRSQDLHGEAGGWDESCMLNAVLVFVDTGELAGPPLPPVRPMQTWEQILAMSIDPELVAAINERLRK